MWIESDSIGIINKNKSEKRRSVMLAGERHDQIVEQVNERGSVLVKDLSEQFGVTEDSIRKDLTMLERKGLLKKAYGGAVKIRENPHERYASQRRGKNLAQKTAIAKKAEEEAASKAAAEAAAAAQAAAEAAAAQAAAEAAAAQAAAESNSSSGASASLSPAFPASATTLPCEAW